MKNLYAVLLGGKIRKGNLMEDHQLVLVVADSEKKARASAKKKWKAESMHVDGTQKIMAVDGHDVILKKGKKPDSYEVNNNHSV